MIALEHGAQHVWRRTVVSPIGACISDFLFICHFPCTGVETFAPVHGSSEQRYTKLCKFAPAVINGCSRYMEKILSKRRGLLALSPLVVFLCVYLVSSIIAKDFYCIPISSAFLIGTILSDHNFVMPLSRHWRATSGKVL